MRRLAMVAILTLTSPLLAAEPVVEPTRVTVRAVARGAEILGSNVGGARITIVDVATGESLASGFQEGSTGDTSRIMESTAGSKMAVCVTPGAAAYEAMLPIREPRLVEIIVEGPLGLPGAVRRASRQILVIPGQHIEGDGVVVELQGYSVLINEPTADEPIVAGSTIRVRATVTMLCGCPLEPGGPWYSDRVRIVARLVDEHGRTLEQALANAGDQSLFEGEVPVAEPGTFDLQVLALNAGTGDSGIAEVRLRSEPRLTGSLDGEVQLAQRSGVTFVSLVPDDPREVVVLAHGYPWPDETRSIPQLAAHAADYVSRWETLARRHRAILIAPVFGSGPLAGYRELHGESVDADQFVISLVDELGSRWIDAFDGRFFLYGHSAGGQFANRFLVVHPGRLKGAILSAPGRYAYPDTSVAWPYGSAAAPATSRARKRSKPTSAGPYFRPDPGTWAQAASHTPIVIVIGSEDTEPRSAEPAHPNASRIDYARKWQSAMNELAGNSGARNRVSLQLVDGVAHDPVGLTPVAQRALEEMMRASSSATGSEAGIERPERRGDDRPEAAPRRGVAR